MSPFTQRLVLVKLTLAAISSASRAADWTWDERPGQSVALKAGDQIQLFERA